MSEENVEIVRRSYAAFNAAVSATNPQDAIRAAFEDYSIPRSSGR